MYSASAQFHNAVFENSPVERVLFRFADGTIFTNEDINVSAGLKVIEAVNLEEELTIGGCPASSIDATIMNYHGLLSGFTFGEAEVSLGVLTETTLKDAVEANCVAYLGDRKICGYSNAPYLTFDDEATAVQPDFPVRSIVADGLDIYCIGADGQCWKATLGDRWTYDEMATYTKDEFDATSIVWNDIQGTLTAAGNVPLSAFMTAKAAKWAEQGRGLWSNCGVIYEYYTDGTAERYEYAKLGTFLLNTPAKRKINLIAISALDKMSLFDREADAFWNGLTYPITIGEIFTQLCAFVGVQKATTSFINSARLLDEAPMAAENITAREILGWVAQAACSFARMTRDGEVELAWFGTRPVSIPMTQYFSISPAEYTVAPIDKLQISGSETDIGVIIGSGDNGYQIMDNPLLYGETDTEIRTLGVPIYNRLAAYATFSPIVATAVCDWSIQAGDIIEIVLNGVTYALPIYTQTITWKGSARVSYESTGAERRPVMNATNRRAFRQGRAIHEISETVDGLTRHLEGVEGDVADLALTVDNFSLEFVSKDGVISSINQSAEAIKIAAANIALEGIITANDRFKILADGSAQMTSADVSGKITSDSGRIASFNISSTSLYAGDTFDNQISLYSNSSSAGIIIGPGAITYDSTTDPEGVIMHKSGISLGGYNLVAQSRILFTSTPPSSGGTANARLVQRDNGGYSLGLVSSSRRYKKRIHPVSPEGLAEKIDRIDAVTYEPRGGMEKGHAFYGFIAEDMEQEFPWLVDYGIENGAYEAQSIEYDRVPAILWADAQNTHAELKRLRAEIEEMKRRLYERQNP